MIPGHRAGSASAVLGLRIATMVLRTSRPALNGLKTCSRPAGLNVLGHDQQA